MYQAGNLESISSSYTTRPSGRNVHLELFSERENISKLGHAMEALKKSMKWDEDEFGLEYDLDIYNIVAANDVNMAAMENKGLNLFNSAWILADPKISNDADYEQVSELLYATRKPEDEISHSWLIQIESVIGHEYFHNWTGNRVTCRDWFQVCVCHLVSVSDAFLCPQKL